MATKDAGRIKATKKGAVDQDPESEPLTALRG
jgi:hypothetical protein